MSDIALPNGVSRSLRGERLLGDERLARLVSRGSASAFAALYERHHQEIYRYCRSIVRNEHDAQDALQSAMTRAYAALCARERDLAVRPWLFRIAHNEAVSILRKRRREHELSEDWEEPGAGVEGAVDMRERLATLVADLQALPERQRAALLMRELSDLSIQEIADALSISQGAAKQTLFEARTSLHELSEGRAMQCDSVREAISQHDGRVLRGRRIRSHLRACRECREFQQAIATRRADLLALAPPLPVVAASAVLRGLLAHGAGGHAGTAAIAGSGGASAGGGASVGGHAVASLALKGVAGIAVVAAATAGTVRLTAAPHRHHGTPLPAASPQSAAAPRGARATAHSRRGGGMPGPLAGGQLPTTTSTQQTAAQRTATQPGASSPGASRGVGSAGPGQRYTAHRPPHTPAGSRPATHRQTRHPSGQRLASHHHARGVSPSHRPPTGDNGSHRQSSPHGSTSHGQPAEPGEQGLTSSEQRHSAPAGVGAAQGVPGSAPPRNETAPR